MFMKVNKSMPYELIALAWRWSVTCAALLSLLFHFQSCHFVPPESPTIFTAFK